MIRCLDRCPIHQQLYSGVCMVCEKEKALGKDAGSLGSLRGERVEDTEGRTIDLDKEK